MLLVEFFSEPDEEVVVLDGVRDRGELLWDLPLLEQVGNLRPVVLMLGAESVGESALVVLEVPTLRLTVCGGVSTREAWLSLLISRGSFGTAI